MRTLDDVSALRPHSFLSDLPTDDRTIRSPKLIRERQGAIKGYFVTHVELRDGISHDVHVDDSATVFVDSYGFAIRMRRPGARLFSKFTWFYIAYYDVNLIRESTRRLELVDTSNTVGLYFKKKKAIKFVSSLVDGFSINRIAV